MLNPLKDARYLISETDPMGLPPSLAEVAVVGRSNVGKSSLLCALCENKKLARVSKTPGRTRAINVFEIKRDRWLIDLPGYGYADAPQKEREYWPKMISIFLSSRRCMAKVFLLIDAERGACDIDLSLLEWLREQNLNVGIVGTKVDRLSVHQQTQARAQMAAATAFKPDDLFWVSTKEGWGVKKLRQDVIQTLQV